MNRELLITIYVRFSILAALCFVGCALGLLALYLQGYPMQGAIPWPITAMFLGYGVYGAVALFCYVAAQCSGPNDGGGKPLIDDTKILKRQKATA